MAQVHIVQPTREIEALPSVAAADMPTPGKGAVAHVDPDDRPLKVVKFRMADGSTLEIGTSATRVDASTYATVAEAVTAVGSSGTLYLPKRATTYSVGANTTLAAGVRVVVDPGATITVAGTFTLTINGHVVADENAAIFAGAGSVVLSPVTNPTVSVAWWGVTNAAITKAVAAVNNVGRLVFPELVFTVSDDATVPVGIASVLRGLVRFDVADGKKLIFAGPTSVEAPNAQHFYFSTGAIFMSATSELIMSDWWGLNVSTDATPFGVIVVQSPAASCAFSGLLTVSAYRTGGARGSGAIGDSAVFTRRLGVKMVGAMTGTPAAIAAPDTIGTDMVDADLTAGGIGIAIGYDPGGRFYVTSTGVAATNLTWRATWQTLCRTEP